MRRNLLICLLFCLMSGSLSGICDEIKDKQEELKKIQAQIKSEKKKEQELSEKERERKKLLLDIEKALEKKKDILSKYKSQISTTEKKLESVNTKLSKGRNDLLNSQNLAAVKVRVFYKKIFFSVFSRGMNKLSDLKKYPFCMDAFKRIIMEDSAFISALENEARSLQSKKVLLDKDKNWLEHIKKKQEKEKREKEEKRSGEVAELSKIRSKIGAVRKKKAALAEEASELESFIKTLIAKKSTPSNIKKGEALVFERDKDKLSWPVSRGTVIKYFGWNASDKHNAPFFNPGVDIEVRNSENVLSVAKGKVLFSGSFRSYGEMVIVDHGGGYCSVYSGLSKVMVKANQKVEKEEDMGVVSSVLHFEMRKDSKPVDPLNWLKNK